MRWNEIVERFDADGFVLLRYVKPLEEIDRLAPEHFRFLQRYFDSGIFILAGRQVPRVGGVIIAAGITAQELDAIVREDPFCREGAAAYRILEFLPGKYDTRLESLVRRGSPALYGAGASVAIAARDVGRLETARQEIAGHGRPERSGTVIVVPADLIGSPL